MFKKHFRKCWEMESGEIREQKKWREEENGSRRKTRTGIIMSKCLYSEASPWAVLPPKCNSKRRVAKICVQISVGSFRISWSKWASNTWEATCSRERSAILWSESVDCCLSSADRVTLGTSSPVWCQLHILHLSPSTTAFPVTIVVLTTISSSSSGGGGVQQKGLERSSGPGFPILQTL